MHSQHASHVSDGRVLSSSGSSSAMYIELVLRFELNK